MSWYPPGSHIPPPFFPRVFKVHDLAPTHLTGPRLTWWRQLRPVALAMWKPAADFRVTEPLAGYKPGFITLDVTQTQDGTKGQADFGRTPPVLATGHQDPAPGVAWVHIDTEFFEQSYLSGLNSSMRHVLAHEVGHTLGFDHGGTGLMSTYAEGNVNAEEINALRAYWRT